MATYISNQTGNWSAASTWLTAAAGVLSPTAVAGVSPQSFGKDKIIIRNNHTVTYDVSGCFGDETSNWGQGTGTTSSTTAGISANSIILSGGTLKASRTINTELTAWGNIVIAPSGTLDWGTTVDPLTTNSNITLHYMSQLSALSASIGSAGIYLYGAAAFGDSYKNNIYINGKPKTKNTTLSLSAVNGASVLTLAFPATALGWGVGDRLVVATESISAVTTNVASVPITVLSATYIQSFTGNQVTISPPLNTSRSANTNIGNFNSNVTIKSYNQYYPSYGIYINGSNSFGIDISNVRLESMGYGAAQTLFGNVGWSPYATNGVRAPAVFTGNPLGQLTINIPLGVPSSQLNILPLKGIAIENFTTSTTTSNYLGITPPVAWGIYTNGRYSDYVVIDDCAIFMQSPFSTFGFQVNSLASLILKNSVVYRAAYPMQYSSAFPNSIIIDNVSFDATVAPFVNTYGLVSNVTNSRFRTPIGTTSNYILPLDSIQNLSFKNCTFTFSTSAGTIFQPNANAVGSMTMSNCYFYNNTTQLSGILTKTSIGASNVTGQTAQINIYQPNNSIYDYRRFNYFHYSQTDLINRKRGITSYRIKPETANTQFYNYFTIPATINTPQRIKGSLRFNSNYGTTYPPSISFVGAGVNTTFTCTSTVDTWQDFDYTLTPTSTDDIIITITCQSTLTTGYVWLDGLPIYPFIQDVRHYGFLFDAVIDRTVNTHNTLTENQVSALSTISNLDYLYDSATYWSVTNPSSSSYVDLVTIDGSTLDFDGHVFVIDSNASTTMAYNSTNNTVTIKSSVLSAGSNFDTLMTTASAVFLNNPNIASDVKIRSSNYNSEITYGGVDYVILYKSQSDADNSINSGLSSTNGIIRFKYGETTQGVPMSGTIYAKWYSSASSTSGVNAQTLITGTNTLGDLVGYGLIKYNLNVINRGIQKSSILIPHTTNINSGSNLTTDIQELVNSQQIINIGVQKASKLIPHNTNI